MHLESADIIETQAISNSSNIYSKIMKIDLVVDSNFQNNAEPHAFRSRFYGLITVAKLKEMKALS